MDPREMECKDGGVDRTGSWYSLMAGCCNHGNEPLRSCNAGIL
jgi:hypothetical protein